MAKKSLLSSEYDSIGRKGTSGRGGGGGGGRTNKDKIKIGLAVGLLVFSGLILAWHFGLFERTIPADYEPPPPEVIAEFEEEQRIQEELVERGVIAAPAAE